MKRKYAQKKIDGDVVAQAEDDSAWGKPIRARRKKRRLLGQNMNWQRIHSMFPMDQNYVSCSPFRVPVARLAAAQAALTPIAEDT